MLRRIPFRAILPAMLFASILSLSAFAQQQETQSVAEAAKQARDKKNNTPKPVKVVTEDDIEKKNAMSGEQGVTADNSQRLETNSSSNAAVAAAESGDAAATPPIPATNTGEADARKAQLAAAQKELDLLKRDLALQQDTFFSNADYARDKAGKAKLDAMQQQVADKQQAVDQLKAAVNALPAPKVAPKPATPETPATPPQS